MAIEVEGDRIRAWFGGELAVDVTDESALSIRYGGIGMIGLWENPFVVDSVRVLAIP